MSSTKEHVCIVIGASHGGVNFAFNLRKEGWEGEIILYDADPMIPYHRPPLSKSYLIDGNLESNLLKPWETYKKENIQLKLGQVVTSIDTKEQRITLQDGETHPFDKLVIATGARPLIPPIPGIDKATNVFAVRTARDAMNIKKAFDSSKDKRVVVIGGGYIGLETAASLNKLKASVTVLERESRVLASVTAPVMSEYFTTLHQEHGVTVLTEKNVVSVESKEGYNTILCDDNTSFDADMIILGVGIKVNQELAEQIDLDIDNGIKVNQFAQTSYNNIYAIGDCTHHFNPHYQRYIRLESVQNAVDQGKVAAAHICGKEAIYDTIPWFWSDQYDTKLQMVGLSDEYNEVLVRKESTEHTSFSVWYFKDQELLAVDAVNNPKAYVLGTKFIKENTLINKANLVDETMPLKPLTLKQIEL